MTVSDCNPPQLPIQVSPDGREIWDWAGRFSEHVHRLDTIRKTQLDLAGIGSVCGDCNHWMKSRLCPRERNVNGYNRGPSMGDHKCAQFAASPESTKRQRELTARLNELQEPTP